MRDKSYFFDLNSSAPSSKQRSSKVLRHMWRVLRGRRSDGTCLCQEKPCSPFNLWGQTTCRLPLEKLPMNARVIDGPSVAHLAKMVRSIMVKGLEALTAECAIATIEADVLDEVFVSLSRGPSYFNISTHAMYNLERSLSHGKRRAEELKEVSKMLDDLGLINHMSKAAAFGRKNWGH